MSARQGPAVLNHLGIGKLGCKEGMLLVYLAVVRRPIAPQRYQIRFYTLEAVSTAIFNLQTQLNYSKILLGDEISWYAVEGS
jgi:hypothetical protein